MAAVCHLGFVLCIWSFWTIHEAQLVVFIAVQNLAVVGIVVWKISDFQYFAH